MPAKAKITKELLADIVVHAYRSASADDLAAKHGVKRSVIERLASQMRKQGAKIPKQSRVYRNSVKAMIAELRQELPGAFA